MTIPVRWLLASRLCPDALAVAALAFARPVQASVIQVAFSAAAPTLSDMTSSARVLPGRLEGEPLPASVCRPPASCRLPAVPA